MLAVEVVVVCLQVASVVSLVAVVGVYSKSSCISNSSSRTVVENINSSSSTGFDTNVTVAVCSQAWGKIDKNFQVFMDFFFKLL